MKIVYVTTRSQSGNEVYYDLLFKEMSGVHGFHVKKITISSIYEKLPWLLFFKRKLLMLENSDIIHTNVEIGHYLKTPGVKLVVTVHHDVFDEIYQKHTSLFQKIFHYWILKRSMRLSLNSADKVVAISQYTRKSIEKHFGFREKISVIYCGVNLDIYRPIKVKKRTDKVMLLFVGNGSKRKGFDLLPKIMNKLGGKYVLFFTGGLRGSSQHDLAENMVSVGRLSQTELVRILNECDIFLFPSRLEGFGYAPAEAMACGKPVVTTNYSALPEVVEHSRNGILCRIDDVDDFVSACKKIAAQLRSRDYRHNRDDMIRKFSLKKLNAQYVILYRNVVLDTRLPW